MADPIQAGILIIVSLLAGNEEIKITRGPVEALSSCLKRADSVMNDPKKSWITSDGQQIVTRWVVCEAMWKPDFETGVRLQTGTP